MQRGEQDVFVRPEADEFRAERDLPVEGERLPLSSLVVAQCFLARVGGKGGKVRTAEDGVRERQRYDRSAGSRGADHASERFVPIEDDADRPLEPVGVERSVDAGDERNVVGDRVRMDLLEEPEPFLRWRERDFTRGRLEGPDRRRAERRRRFGRDERDQGGLVFAKNAEDRLVENAGSGVRPQAVTLQLETDPELPQRRENLPRRRCAPEFEEVRHRRTPLPSGAPRTAPLVTGRESPRGALPDRRAAEHRRSCGAEALHPTDHA